MNRHGVTEFSGIGGRVLSGTLSLGTMFSGVCFCILLFTGCWFFLQWEMEAVANCYAQALIAMALARYALNGLSGEHSGTIFSTAGGGWTKVAGVAARYMSLSLLWLVPFLIVGLNIKELGPELVSLVSGLGGGRTLTILIFYLMAVSISPPIFLIASVRATRFGDLITREFWRLIFGGRFGDLFYIYALYLGGGLGAIGLCLPAIIGGFSQDVSFGLFLAAVATVFLIGMCTDLLGRLCGFYAFGEDAPAARVGVLSSPSDAAPLLARTGVVPPAGAVPQAAVAHAPGQTPAPVTGYAPGQPPAQTAARAPAGPRKPALIDAPKRV